MRVLIAPDKFKGALSAEQAATALARGIQLARPHARLTLVPVTDGGDGFARIMTRHAGGSWQQTSVSGPLQAPVPAGWGWQAQLKHAWLDCAEVIGLRLLAPKQHNPGRTTTYGLGQLIGYIQQRYTPALLTVGLGGSSTHDGGCGLAAALGYRFLDASGKAFVPTGDTLGQIAHIVPPTRWALPKLLAAVDVPNPLTGPRGAAYTFAAQKGADSAQIAKLEAGTRHLAEKVATDLGMDDSSEAGCGAAGGLGFGLKVFAGAKLVPGAQKVADLLHLPQHINQTDWVITGEGRWDASSEQGKITGHIAKLALKAGKKLTIFCGTATTEAPAGADLHTIAIAGQSLEENLRQCAGLLTEAACQWAKK